MREARVFIAYNNENRDWARELALTLRDRGIQTWYAEDEVRPGTDTQKSLINALKHSDTYALIIGRKTLMNPNVMFEMGVAAATGRPVIPIILPEGETEGLLDTIAHIHQIRTDDVRVAADQLARAANFFRDKEAEQDAP